MTSTPKMLGDDAKHLAVVAGWATAAYAVTCVIVIGLFAFAFAIVMVFMGHSLFNWPIWRWLINAIIMASPLTLALLPTVAMLGRANRFLSYIFPLVGLIGGLVAMKLWSLLGRSVPAVKNLLDFYPLYHDFSALYWLLAGALGGLAAGGVFTANVVRVRQ